MSEKTEERLALEARARELGVEFGGNIGDEKLAERVAAAAAAGDQGAPAENTSPGDAGQAAGAASTEVAPVFSEPMVEVIGPHRGRRRVANLVLGYDVILDT